MNKRRVMIQLDPELLRRVRNLAEREGVSVSALVRRWLGEKVRGKGGASRQEWARALDLEGAFRDAPDVSRRHDEYLWGRRD